jgi:hypothetical protein
MLAFTRFGRQGKFTPIVRFDSKDPEAIEVRIEGYDTVAYTLSREQYKEFRTAVGKFNPADKPTPPPTPPPSSNNDDTWGA